MAVINQFTKILKFLLTGLHELSENSIDELFQINFATNILECYNSENCFGDTQMVITGFRFETDFYSFDHSGFCFCDMLHASKYLSSFSAQNKKYPSISI